MRTNRLHALYPSFGGVCQRCGYSRSRRALQFHHRDASEKAMWSKDGHVSPAEVASHPERFELLCANCHFEEHERLELERAATTTCVQCGSVFRTKAHLIANGRVRYCSRPCLHKHRKVLARGNALPRMRKYIRHEGECWVWFGTTVRGYPVIQVQDERGRYSPRSVRRTLYADRHGGTPKGNLRLTCSNTACVNPDHLATRA